jgi:hypothetical protein
MDEINRTKAALVILVVGLIAWVTVFVHLVGG